MAYNGPLPQVVNAGGTGAATITGVLTGNGTSAVTASTVTQHGVVVGGASNAVTTTSVGSTGQVLQANTSADPTYSTATYPSTAGTSGKVLISDGTNIVSSTPTFPNASATSGKIIISDGTNWIASTPTYPATAGTSGNVLTSNGTNWTSAAAGASSALVKIKTVTASASASLSFTSSDITATYTHYLVVFDRLLAATNAVQFFMDWSTDNGSTFLGANYLNGVSDTTPGGTTWNGETSTTTCKLSRAATVANTSLISGTIDLWGLGSSTSPNFTGRLIWVNMQVIPSGMNTGTVTVNNIKFYMSSGNITSGTITLYGVVE